MNLFKDSRRFCSVLYGLIAVCVCLDEFRCVSDSTPVNLHEFIHVSEVIGNGHIILSSTYLETMVSPMNSSR